MNSYRKAGINNELEEQLSKRRVVELWDLGLIDTFEVGTFRGLQQIHEYLFQVSYLLEFFQIPPMKHKHE